MEKDVPQKEDQEGHDLVPEKHVEEDMCRHSGGLCQSTSNTLGM